jgi:hypothetical protein
MTTTVDTGLASIPCEATVAILYLESAHGPAVDGGMVMAKDELQRSLDWA